MLIKLRASALLRNDVIQVSSKLAKRWKFAKEQAVKLKFGITTVPVKIQVVRKSETNEIVISAIALKKLKVPAGCSYQLKKEKNTIIIGPYIGILLDRVGGKVSAKDLIPYSKVYNQIGGALLAFSPWDVNTHSRKIAGYLFKPSIGIWVRGEYSYPSSILNKSGERERLIDHFIRLLGKTVYNDYRYDKWTMYRLLSRNAKIRRLLPKTLLYQRVRDVERMLRYCSVLYMKPIHGSGGMHIVKLTKENGRIVVTHKASGNHYVDKHFTDMKSLSRFLGKLTLGRKYLLQERIKLPTRKGRLVDFRMIVVKDENGMWKDMGIVSRYGPKKSIVSNISAGGLAEEGTRTLRKLLPHRGAKGIRAIRNQMANYANQTARYLNSSGLHLGNLGFDFALDTQGNIWILEVNHNDPNHTIALDAGENKMYYNTIKANLLYAKKLAGFSRRSTL